MLELRNIVHYYDGKKLLGGVNFSVGEDEVLCLLGPSGSGKSTILRIIAGFETPAEGEVLYNGRNILNDPVYKRNFGMVFQDYALFPHMNVYENIAFGLKMQRESGAELDLKVKNALSQVGMAGFAERKVTDLSGGEQQRVALARSLVVHPALLMLDEPLGALDYSLRQTLIGELREILGKNGIPAIYVTHDQNEAMSLSDRIAILHDGKIIQTDIPEKLFERPADPWCAGFLGFHNFIPGTVTADGHICVSNFSEKKIFSYPACPAAPGSPVTVLLKDGSVTASDSKDVKNSLTLEAIPVQNIYRGDYYDVQMKIDEKTEITLKNKEKLALDSKVYIFCSGEQIIVYPSGSSGK